MQNENIFEVNEAKSVNITERQLTDAIAEAVSNALHKIEKKVEGDGEHTGRLFMMYMMIGAEIHHELQDILFGDSDT